ncbi:hypothetical protein CP118TE_05040 [Clostridium perfringens E]|nr:hypothetical protein CP118TE_05040 [Clostridium perfringens E]
MKENLNLFKFLFGTTILLCGLSKDIILNSIRYTKTTLKAKLRKGK